MHVPCRYISGNSQNPTGMPIITHMKDHVRLSQESGLWLGHIPTYNLKGPEWKTTWRRFVDLKYLGRLHERVTRHNLYYSPRYLYRYLYRFVPIRKVELYMPNHGTECDYCVPSPSKNVFWIVIAPFPRPKEAVATALCKPCAMRTESRAMRTEENDKGGMLGEMTSRGTVVWSSHWNKKGLEFHFPKEKIFTTTSCSSMYLPSTEWRHDCITSNRYSLSIWP